MMDQQHQQQQQQQQQQQLNSNSMLQDYERQSNMRRRQIELNFEMLFSSFACQIEESLSRLPHQIRQLTLNQLINQNCYSYDEIDDGFDEVLSITTTSHTDSKSVSNLNKQNDKIYCTSSLEFSNITPKIKPNTQLNMLRRPKEGEMVVSMQGSPILISGIIKKNTANINVPLGNGKMMSLMPHDGLQLSLLPNLDEETMKQLKILKRHIESVIGNK